MRFTKMQAFGNDYVYIDGVRQKLSRYAELARAVSDRHYGVGSDGMVLILPSEKADFMMRIFNPDGTEGEMCGNALRSTGKFVYEHAMTDKTELAIETKSGIRSVRLFVKNGAVEDIEADIGAPVFDTGLIPVSTPLPEFVDRPVRILDREFRLTALSWGNPHCVAFVNDLDTLDVAAYGRSIEHKTDLFPHRTNVTFAEIIDRGHIRIREWERSAGETLGCGTGCCTAAVAAVLAGKCDRDIDVEQPGGVLHTRWDERSGSMIMRGPSHTVFESDIDVSSVLGRDENREHNLLRLLDGVEYTVIGGTPEGVEISDIRYDSRLCEEGDLFVARVGTTSDSHSFIPEAVQRGAKAVVVERDCEVPEGVVAIKVPSSAGALALLSAAYFRHPASRMTVIGITGTAGKTSVSYMVKAILERSGGKTGLIGTTGAIIGNKRIELHNTTPESYELQKLLSQMADEGCRYAVTEVSSQGLKMRRVDGFTFDYGVFTNISPDHIGPGEHADFEEYLACKSLLFRRCRVGVVNADDPLLPEVIKDHTCRIVSYGFGEEADAKAKDLRLLSTGGFLGSEFSVTGAVTGKFTVGVPGRFSAYNALAAVTVCAEAGAAPEIMSDALTDVAVPGRMETVYSDSRRIVIIDYAHNEAEMENLMETVSEYHPKRLICVFGCGGNRAKARRYAMGEIAGRYADLIILTADNPRWESLDSINADVIEGIERAGGRYIRVDDRAEAINTSLRGARDGDVILLIGKGHEKYMEVRGERAFWDERAAALEAVKLLPD